MDRLPLVEWKTYPPLIVTLDELKARLLPVTLGYKWGENTVHDLWIMGAPTPQDTSRRIVFPRQLAIWLEDVLTRQGRPLDTAAQVYNDIRKRSV